MLFANIKIIVYKFLNSSGKAFTELAKQKVSLIRVLNVYSRSSAAGWIWGAAPHTNLYFLLPSLMHLDYRSSTTDCNTLAILKLFWPKLHLQPPFFVNLDRPQAFPNSIYVVSWNMDSKGSCLKFADWTTLVTKTPFVVLSAASWNKKLGLIWFAGCNRIRKAFFTNIN